MKKILLSVIAIVFAMNAEAQTTDKKWSVGFHYGSQQYKGEIGNGFYDFKQDYGFGGMTLSRNINDYLDIELNGSIGKVGYNNGTSSSFEYNLFQMNINARYNFFKYDEVKLRPFVFAGIGYLNFSDENSDRKVSAMQLPHFGAGLAIKVSPTISIMLRETMMYSNSDAIDTKVVAGTGNDFYLQHSVGISFNLGKIQDADGDGVADKKDKCPNIAGLVALEGCPDTDNDGVADADDTCPQTAGLKEFNGCPDSDGDGVADANDKCPKVKGLKAFNGCPDTDGDGISDADDKCPTIKGSKEFNGCIDSDGDGIADPEDKCPKVKGLKSLGGCPDADGDGVADKDDKCPQVKGLKSLGGCPDADGDGITDKEDLCPNDVGTSANKGCPEVKDDDKKVLHDALHGIKFTTGGSHILNSSLKILDNVVDIMKKNAEYKLTIAGYTDSQGNDNVNLQLSKKRARAVEDYLISKGIAESRMKSDGFGETKPIADNKTAKGRSDNRRVELTISFE